MKNICRIELHGPRCIGLITLISWLVSLLPSTAQEGVPFYVNYYANDYNAHNRNFDVVCDSTGIPFVANFEGVIYYNGASWNRMLTPGISRVTKLYVDRFQQIWAGGYNYIGKVVCSEIGTPQLMTYITDDDAQQESALIGEVDDICEQGDTLIFLTQKYKIAIGRNEFGRDTILGRESYASLTETVPRDTLLLEQRWTVSNPLDAGLLIKDNESGALYPMTEANGLCSNVVNGIAYDHRGSLWAATDNGVFRVYLPSFYAQYTSREGLHGEVTAIIRYQHILYVGTLHGLFRYNNRTAKFEAVTDIKQSCWQLIQGPKGNLYAATSGGLFRVEGSNAQQVSSGNTFSAVIQDKDESIIYTGEIDGIYRRQGKDSRKISDIEKAMSLSFFHGHLWIETLYGELYCLNDEMQIVQLDEKQGLGSVKGNRMYMFESGPLVMSMQGLQLWNEDSQQLEKLPLPTLTIDTLLANQDWRQGLFAASPSMQEYWLMGGDYKGLLVFRNNQLDTIKGQKLAPFRNYVIRTLYLEDDEKAWIGGDFGLRLFNSHNTDASFQLQPKVHIRRIRINNTSLYYDGATGAHEELLSQPEIEFNSSNKEFDFEFSADANDLLNQMRYAYYLEGYENTWHLWSRETMKEYTNLSFGHYTFHVKAMDAFGRESDEVTFSFTIKLPFYLKWYCCLLYLGLFFFCTWLFFKWRTRKLLQQNEQLEAIVAERTLQIREQRDEISEKSQKLETALTELKEAQTRLIRQEKVATVGKLTHGLIDRILNPMNYIINFSHLSVSLLKDMREDVEDEAENMSEDNLDDMREIMEMLQEHMTKIENHGNSTSRILKAMEELLTDHTCHFVSIDIRELLSESWGFFKEYYKTDIQELNLSFQLEADSDSVVADVDKLLLSKVIGSLLQNSLYALQRKRKKGDFDAQITIRIKRQDKRVVIVMRDNGIGIEETVLDKVFDPFFTTKTTAEAAGVGLYLCREIILNHNGTISVDSVKDSYTEFTIIIPIHQSINTKSDE